MKRFLLISLLGVLAVGALFAQQELYQRSFINLPPTVPTSVGNFVAGVDLDGDGKLEVYFVNNDWNDSSPDELTPWIYKYEQNANGGWDSVWSHKMNIPLQNTWPALCVADLDNDGKKEIVWGPANFLDASTNPNPSRVIVFESNPGSDVMGVNGEPNTTWTITQTASFELRPFKWFTHTFGGKQMLVFADRRTQGGAYRFGVISVNDIPDDGVQTNVVWTLETSGKDMTWKSGTVYDIFALDSTIFVMQDGSLNYVTPVTYNNGTFTIHGPDSSKVPGGSWKSATVVDVNNDGKKEVIVAGYGASAGQNKIYLLDKTSDTTVASYVIADLAPLVGTARLYGGNVGDIGGDGKIDFVCGTRGSNPNGMIVRLSYTNGAVQDNGSYVASVIDRGIAAVGADLRLDQIQLANVDGNAGDEVFYTNCTDGRIPIVILSNGKKAVNVSFNANTSMVPDTLSSKSFVQIRGGGAQITWGLDSPAKMVNVGGDYWKYTGLFPSGDTIPYKFFTNAQSVVPGADEHKGWEGDTKDWGNGNRRLVVGNSNMDLPVEYVNGFNGSNYMQHDATFNNNQADDTVWAHLRVNMQSYPSFNPAIHKVGVRGSFAASGWGTTVIMKQEAPHANGGSQQYNAANFYYLDIPWKKSFLDTATDYEATVMRYKFVIHLKDAPNDEDWGKMVDNPNYQLEWKMPAKDTTQAWVWYRGVAYVPPKGTDTVNVKFRTDLSTAIAQKGMKPGDVVVVKYGWGSTAQEIYTDTLKKVGLSGNVYESAQRQAAGVSTTNPVQYQYYLLLPGNELREIYYDFGYTGADPGAAERRKFMVPSNNATMTVFDTAQSIIDHHRRPIWQNTNKLAQNVLVTFECDLRPAYYHLAGGDSLFDVQGAFRTILPTDKDSVYSWGVWMNGPAVGGWSNPGGSDWGLGLRTNDAKKMYDDGTHGDKVAGDHIYTLQVQFYKDSLNNTVGQVFKFGLYAGDNEGGKGGFGNNHVANIDDAGTTATISDQFGSINPTYYKAWNYDKKEPVLGVSRQDNTIPNVFALEQNYPNPFNPSTTINYSIPTESFVTLKIYNMLGQEVATVVNEQLNAGKYNVTFNAGNFASGVYIYRIEAGSFVSVKKMMLLK